MRLRVRGVVSRLSHSSAKSGREEEATLSEPMVCLHVNAAEFGGDETHYRLSLLIGPEWLRGKTILCFYLSRLSLPMVSVWRLLYRFAIAIADVDVQVFLRCTTT